MSALDPGDGAVEHDHRRWALTICALLMPRPGQVALFTCVEESERLSPAASAWALKAARIAEVETVVARNADEGFPFLGQTFERKPAMEAMVPPAERSSREELIDLANGYFETIERNDGTIRTSFWPHCNRVENGVQTTNNPDFPLPIARLGCEEQFAPRLVSL